MFAFSNDFVCNPAIWKVLFYFILYTDTVVLTKCLSDLVHKWVFRAKKNGYKLIIYIADVHLNKGECPLMQQ